MINEEPAFLIVLVHLILINKQQRDKQDKNTPRRQRLEDNTIASIA